MKLTIIAALTGLAGSALHAQCGGGGSNFSESFPNTWASTSIRHNQPDDGDGILEAAAIIRGPASWLSRPHAKTDAKKPNGDPIYGSGATIGPAWVTFEDEARTYWFDSTPFPMDTNNVLLIEVDS